MSNVIFPALPGLAWSVLKTPTWRTGIQQAYSGKEVRIAYRDRPIWRFALSYEFLRGASRYAELQKLAGFFNARRGAFDSFLFRDPSDYTVAGQAFGVGDGTRKAWALVHAMDGWTEPIGHSGDGLIYVNGSLKTFGTDFTADGVNVFFINAPPAGAALTWSGTFEYRVRFEKDSMEFDQFMKDLWQLKKCELVGVI